MSSPEPAISVITATYNGASRIIHLLNALLKQRFTDFELIIISDGSSDDTVELLNSKRTLFGNMTILDEKENHGRPFCLNKASHTAKGKLLLFLDDDMIPDENCLQNHFDIQSEKNFSCMLIGNGYRDPSAAITSFDHYLIEKEAIWKSKHEEQFRVSKNHFATTTCNISIPRELFLSLGGFDGGMRDLEDLEFTLRMLAKNIPVYYDRSIIAWHNDFPGLRKFIDRQNQYHHARSVAASKHASIAEHFKSRDITLKKNSFGKKMMFIFRNNHFLDIDKKWNHAPKNRLSRAYRYLLFRLIISANIRDEE